MLYENAIHKPKRKPNSAKLGDCNPFRRRCEKGWLSPTFASHAIPGHAANATFASHAIAGHAANATFASHAIAGHVANPQAAAQPPRTRWRIDHF